jgi:glycosyltransferase involved in cell wall biosynthesis
VRVSVVIPARDEELLLPRCLASIAKQDVPIHETIVVDDDSNDATARVASLGGARVASAGTRPSGWAGKPWAAHVGSKEATGDWLLFIDADAILAPQCVRAAIADGEEHATDLLTLMPRPTCSTPFEAMAQPLFLMVTMGALDMRASTIPRARWRQHGADSCSSGEFRTTRLAATSE